MQDERGQVIGAAVHDHLGRKSYDVYAKQVGHGYAVSSHWNQCFEQDLFAFQCTN